MSSDEWAWARIPKTKAIRCVVCSRLWEAIAVDGYYVCPHEDCGYLNPVPWEPPKSGFKESD